MNKAKTKLYKYQKRNFPLQSHLICDFDLNAYPETAGVVYLTKIAKAIGVSTSNNTEQELRQKVLAEFDKAPPPKKNKKP